MLSKQCLGLRVLGFGVGTGIIWGVGIVPQLLENQMDKKIDNYVETGFMVQAMPIMQLLITGWGVHLKDTNQRALC